MYFEIVFVGFNGKDFNSLPDFCLIQAAARAASCFLRMSSKLFLFCGVGIKQKVLVFLCLANLDGGINRVTSNLEKASVELMA